MSWWPDKCTICKEVVSKLCSSAAGGIVDCAETCGRICIDLIENPLAAAICEIVCTAVCTLGTNYICSNTVSVVCKEAGLC